MPWHYRLLLWKQSFISFHFQIFIISFFVLLGIHARIQASNLPWANTASIGWLLYLRDGKESLCLPFPEWHFRPHRIPWFHLWRSQQYALDLFRSFTRNWAVSSRQSLIGGLPQDKSLKITNQSHRGNRVIFYFTPIYVRTLTD